MTWLSKKITEYVVRSTAISSESFAIYQYGFQIGLEMISCFVVCFGLAVYLQMIPEFVVVTGIFMMLRTYVGGVHLNSFGACFICSIVVQTSILIINNLYMLSLPVAWVMIVLTIILILKITPVESINRELDEEEKRHCRKVTAKLMVAIFVFAGICTLFDIKEMVSLTSFTMIVVLISQCIGAAKYKMEKNR